MQIFLAQECLPCCKPYFSAHLGPTTQQSESVSQENEIGHYIPTKSEPPIIFVHPALLRIWTRNGGSIESSIAHMKFSVGGRAGLWLQLFLCDCY